MTAQLYLRGPAASRGLQYFGIDPLRYWLLIDLFGELTDRREMLGHLGRDGISLKTAAVMYAIFTALIAAVQVMLSAPVRAYFITFLVLTAFFLLTVLLSETSNSLVNPVEGMVLAHYPINGATYTAAKLTHLLRILVYTVPALNLLPALAGLLLPGASWSYPVLHFLSACVLGLVIALCCCAFFGWLIRFVPAARLKTVGQIAETAPMLLILFMGNLTRILKAMHVKAMHASFPPAILWGLAIACSMAALLGVILGLRALSGDYLVRVSAIVHGGSPAPARRPRPTPLAAAIARLAGGHAGGQTARAGFEYVRRMMFRDWQFRRQLLPILPAAIMPVLLLLDARATPFSGVFTPMHLLPHALGALLFFACTVLAFGSDYKGAWVFLTAPSGAFHGFVRGVHAFLWIAAILIPHLIVLGFLVRNWGPADALLFIAFSLAIASVYLALSLRMVEGVPFGKPVDTSRGAVLLPLMMGGGVVVAIVVAIQHFLLFHSRPLVLAATLLSAVAAYFMTRSSLHTFEVSIRYHLGLVSQESTMLYKEVG